MVVSRSYNLRMDVKKSQRLSHYLGLISDLVQYNDISSLMVEFGTLTVDEHEFLQRKLDANGNVSVMNEFLTMVNLRQGGFDTFLQVLKKTDYEWVAEQLNPETVQAGSSLSSSESKNATRGAKAQTLIANVYRTMNPKGKSDHDSKREDKVLTFMSYRDSCPFDIRVHHQEINLSKPESNNLPVSLSLDSLNNVETDVEVMSINDETRQTPNPSNIVVVENVPKSVLTESCVEYFTKLAKRLDVHSADLKVIRNGKISKKAKRPCKGVSKVKLEFKCELARNIFVQSFKRFTANLEPTDDLYNSVKQLSISVPRAKNFNPDGEGSFSANKLGKCGKGPSSLETSSKRHWYQRRFNLKSWKKNKE